MATIALHPQLEVIAPAIAFTSGGRHHAAHFTDPDATVRVVPMLPGAELLPLVADGGPPIVVFDKRGTADPLAVIAALHAGVVATVHGPSVRVLLAHVDAVLRRLVPAAA
jgi:hypothetical protein